MLMSAVILISTAAVNAQDAITGIWLTQEKNSKVEIYEQGGKYFGKIVWMERETNRKGEPITDVNNPDRSLRSRPILGINMLEELVYTDEKWEGTLYAPKKGRTVDASLELMGEDELLLTVSIMGYTRNQTWVRSEVNP